ncbi:hypothetical protein PENTCL1PPCAC_29705, partial [Pristionchus entomophagus]
AKNDHLSRFVHNVRYANYSVNLYTADLSQVIESNGCKSFTFADDLKIFLSFEKDESSGPLKLQQCIDSILEWSDIWQLSIASEKCNVLHLGNGNQLSKYYLSGIPIDQKSSMRDLGIQIDNELTFREHFDIVIQKAALRSNLIFRGLSTNNPVVMVNAYTTYVRPVVEFSPSVAFPVFDREAGKLEKLQNKERNEMLKLNTLMYRRKVNDFKLAYEMLFGNSRLSRFRNDFLVLSKSNLRGAGFKVCREKFRTKIREHSFANRVGKVLYDVLRKGKIPTNYAEFMNVMCKEVG